jgi:hypothetical protein
VILVDLQVLVADDMLGPVALGLVGWKPVNQAIRGCPVSLRDSPGMRSYYTIMFAGRTLMPLNFRISPKSFNGTLRYLPIA